MSESQGQSLTVVGKGELTPAVVAVAEVLAVGHLWLGERHWYPSQVAWSP